MHSILTMPKLAEKDVFNSFLVRNATYDGKEEIPRITTSNLIPEKVITFSKARNKQEYGRMLNKIFSFAKMQEVELIQFESEFSLSHKKGVN